MDGILNAIKSFIWKKKEDELPKIPLPQPVKIPQLNAPQVSQPSASMKMGQQSINFGGIAKSIAKPVGQFVTGWSDPMREDINKSPAETIGGALAVSPMSAPVKVGSGILQNIPRAVVGLSKMGKEIPFVTNLAKGVEEQVKRGPVGNVPGVPQAAGFIAPMFMGGLSTKSPAKVKQVITSVDELSTVVAKQFGKRGGEDLSISFPSLIKKLGKDIQLSDELLNTLDKKPLVGSYSSIEKVGRNLEFIFDEGFRPLKKFGEKLISNKKPVVAPQKVGVKLGVGSKKPVIENIIPKVEEKPIIKPQGVNLKKPIPKIEDDISQHLAFEPPVSEVKPAAKVKPSRPVNKSEFDSTNRELNAFMKERYELKTPKEYGKMEVKQANVNQKGNLKLIKSADKALDEGLINPEGKGDIKVPFSEFDYANWKDKDIPLLNREIPIRNIEEIAGKDAPKVREFFFDRVTQATQQLENFVATTKKGIEDNVIKRLGIAANSNEDKLTMLFGEGKITQQELMQQAPTKWKQIMEADKYFRRLYDNVLTQVNETITKYGYDPVLRRNDYYTHYQEVGNILEQLGNIAKTEQLPAGINGLTADFRPGKQFFQFAQPRLGKQFTPSAIGSFENYLYPAARQIYNTDVIQRGRALHKVLSEGIRLNEDVPPAHLGNFMAWLNDYTNILAGKKSLMARGSEALLGRKIYGLTNIIKQQSSANLVGANVSSALTNYIPLTQAIATTDKPSFLKGLINAVTSPLTEANLYTIDNVQSSFLRRRFPYKELSTNLWQDVRNKSGWLFTTIDKFTSNSIVAGKYFEGLKKGLDPVKSMAVADEYAMRIIGDRSFGQMPQVFQNQGLFGLLTQFQLEVNNQLSFFAKDVPQMAGGDKLKTASTLAQIALFSNLFNNVFEWVAGRRPAFDPINIVLKSIDTVGSEGSFPDKVSGIAKVVTDNLPFVSILTGGGRIPVAAGIPTPQELAASPGKALLKAGLVYAFPSGGYQLYKTIEGMENYIKGYSETPTGRIKYPIEQDFDNLFRSALFGQYSTPESKKYYDAKETSMGQSQSDTFRLLLERDPQKALSFYNSLHLQRDVNGKISELKAYAQELTPLLSDPSTREDARMKLRQRSEQMKMEIKDILNQTPETSGVFDAIFGKLGELIGNIIGVSADETVGLKAVTPPLDDKTPTDETTRSPLGSFTGLYGMVNEQKKTGVSMKGKKTTAKKIPTSKIKFNFPKLSSSGVNFTPTLKKITPPNIKLITKKLSSKGTASMRVGKRTSRSPFQPLDTFSKFI